MKNFKILNNQKLRDKKRFLREQSHLTHPPRLEGTIKEARTQPIRKNKQHKMNDF